MGLNMPIVLVGLLSLAASCHCAEEGLVASYGFDEGGGNVAHDLSGNGNDGKIIGATFLSTGMGYCLEFDGEGSHVDCGNDPSLDLREAVTTEAWVLPTGRPNGEPGILGKQFESFLLTYYSDGKAWWYIGSGANNVNAPLPPGQWHHIATTFDGKTSSMYVDGTLMGSRASQFDRIPSSANFLIGAVSGRTDATDPNYTRTAHFMGLIDDVRVYNRALSADEIAAHYRAASRPSAPKRELLQFDALVSVGDRQLVVEAGSEGELRLLAERTAYVIESRFSYPGDYIGWNGLPAGRRTPQSDWKPRVTRLSDDALRIAAKGDSYTLTRTVRIAGGLVNIEDVVQNRSREPVGLLVHHDLTSRGAFGDPVVPGGSENPTLFLPSRRGNLGIIMEDDLSRLRYQPEVGLRSNHVGLKLNNIVVDAGKSLVLRWALCPMAPEADYFDFINQMRRRWDVNFTIAGPFSWIYMTDPILDRPEQLKAYLKRKRVRVMAISPWLDYDPGIESRVWSREEYREHALKAVAALKAADPDILCVGCIETDWVTIYPDQIDGGGKLPVHGTGGGLLDHEQTKIIDEANLPFKDSVKRDEQGRLTLELYSRGGRPQTALAVYPAVGNYQFDFLMGQVKFLIDELGLDGYYIDEFSQGWRGGIPSYEGWDGVSAHIDPATGKISRKYVDCSLAGREARVRLCRYALQRGKVVIANTYATAMSEQALPANRFSETQGAFDPMNTPDGVKPPGIAALYRSNLGSPIGLGIVNSPGKQDTARRLMKAIVTYLRHGMVYYHYALDDIPEEGDGSGAYGPVNEMFPITPVELHEGAIIGQERILACVSGEYRWQGPEKPEVMVFELDGRPGSFTVGTARDRKGWVLDLKLKDWAQIAVIAAPGS